ncbi:MAG: DUF2202 domain-containing protein [Flavobacteriaceae bacterium]|jgi:hypothetical protein|nr:DUF2202 domain-containing protein [Flavobacteriaceae bacterium]
MKNVIFKTSIIIVSIMSFNSFGQSANLSKQEVADMKYMLEEEKVARDVYEFLDNKWDLMVFNNIKQSEQNHMDMIENLLNANKVSYKLSAEQGVFYNEQLQKMYHDLIAKGSKSKQDALEVGKTIEVTDIDDLEKAIKNTSNSEISATYSRLAFASNNHLHAFNKNLSRY